MDLLNYTPMKIGLTNNQLKIIAMISMLLDHVGVYLFPNILFRIIGRISFPIFAYMIAEGALHTKNRTKYLLHLLILGIICQLVFFIFMGSLFQGILLTFSLSIITIYVIDYFRKNKTLLSFILMFISILLITFISSVMPIIYQKQGFAFDYGIIGLFVPVIIYFLKHKLLKLIALTILMILISFYYNEPLLLYSLLSIPLIFLYNGNRGKYNLKYMFYIFYPLHLVVIYLLGMVFK